MKISKEMVEEALKRIVEAESVKEPLTDTFKKIKEENPNLANFILSALETWEESPPPTLRDQLSTLFTDLVVLIDIFRRQEEVNKLNKQFGKYLF